MGVPFYLHAGTTKTGKPRYFFAKTVDDRAISSMPEGFEVTESINGVVSVRRKVEGSIVVPEADVKTVEEAVARQPHLKFYKVHALGSAIVIFEPHPRPEELRAQAERYGRLYMSGYYIEDRMKSARYSPVMKFERSAKGDDNYSVFRMTYRGEGGWSYPFDWGKLSDLVKTVVAPIGTEEFFELY